MRTLAVAMLWAFTATTASSPTPADRAVSSSPEPSSPQSSQLFLAWYDRGPAWVEGKTLADQPYLREHIEHFKALADQLIAAGPIQPLEGDRLDGLILFTAPDLAAAQDWLNHDPFVVNRVTSARVVRWMARSVRPWNIANP